MIRFWMVIKAYGSGSQQTSVRHATRATADREAEKLATATGAEFVILEAIATVAPEKAPLKWTPVESGESTD